MAARTQRKKAPRRRPTQKGGEVIEWIGLGDLHAHPRNTKIHPPAQLQALQASLDQFGWVDPVMIDENNVILAGHGMTMAARRRGDKTAKCLRKIGLSEEKKRAYVIADNKLAELSQWDEPLLEMELEELAPLVSLQAMGFSEFKPAETAERKKPEASIFGGSTALQRSSAPLRSWRDAGLVKGDTLDFGCGHEDTGYVRFDPFHHPDYSVLLRQYQTVLSSYVLNVQPADHLVLEVLLLVYKLTLPKGHALVAVRNDLEVGRHETSRGVQTIKPAAEWQEMLANFFEVEPLLAHPDYLHWRCSPRSLK